MSEPVRLSFIAALLGAMLGAISTPAHGQWASVSSGIYYDDGSVGLGMSSPAVGLDLRSSPFL